MHNHKRNIKIIISLVLLVGIYISAPFALYKAANYYEDKKDGKEIAENSYTSTYKYFPYSSKAPQALGSLIALHNPKGEGILITQHFTSAFTQSSIQDIEGIEFYKLLASKYPDSEETKFMTLKVGQHYASLGEYALAEKCFLEGLKVDKESYVPSESNYELIKLYLKNKEPKKALTFIETYRKNYPEGMLGKMYFLEGDAYQQLGDFNKAEDTYKKVLHMDHEVTEAEEKTEAEIIESEENTAIYYQEKLEQRLLRNEKMRANINQEKAKIQGQVTKDGKAMKNISIYLLDENNEDLNFCAKDIVDYPVTALDKQGNYEFKNIIPGKYSIGVVIHKENLEGHTLVPEKQIYEIKSGQTLNLDLKLVPLLKLDKPHLGGNGKEITFQWEQVKNAHHYTLAVGWVKRNKDDISFSSALVQENISANKFTLSKEELLKDNSPQQRPQNMSVEANRQQAGAQTEKKGQETENERSPSLLHKNGKHEFIWSVKAYDKNNNLITDSSGYEFFIDNKRLTTFIIAEDDSNKLQEKGL